MKKTISIIIPTYKPEEYLWNCLDSIYSQTIGLANLELIVVLNGCNEPYYNKITKYISNKPHELETKLIQTDTPGVSNARNIGIKEACGEYISFIDDDDWISDNYFENLIAVTDDNPSIVEANVKNYKEDTGTYHDDYLTKAFYRNIYRKKITLMSGRSFMSSSCCKIIARECIGNNIFNTNFKIGEDSLFMTAISNKVHTIKTASSDTVYYRRLRTTSASRSKPSICRTFINLCKLGIAYTKIYISDIWHYNPFFFSTRLLALPLHLYGTIKKKYTQLHQTKMTNILWT